MKLKMGTKSLYPKRGAAKPASAPKLSISPKGVAPKTAYPVGIGKVSPTDAPPTQPSEPEITAAMTSANARNRLVGAVKFGHDMWRFNAHFRNVRIMAVSAIGTPGCLDGPRLANRIDISPDVQTLSGLEMELYEAVRDGVAACFEDWMSFVTVPGLPWYPAFAAWPGPQAPPMPNVPMPLITCTSARVNRLTGTGLKDSMRDHLRSDLRTSSVMQMFQQIGQSLSTYFMTWLASQQVMMVMGTGPVPTFAPPYVPVGPVMAGSIIEAGSHLAS